MNTEKQLQLCNYEQAKVLRELGFDWNTTNYFNKDEYHTVPAPTVALALKWLRDVKEAVGVIDNNASGYFYQINKKNGTTVYMVGAQASYSDEYETYEAAESALLTEIINYLKSQEK